MAQVIDGFATLAAAEQAAKDRAVQVPGAVVKPLGGAGFMVIASDGEVLVQFRVKSGNGNGNGRRKGKE